MFRRCHTNVISLELILTQEMPSKVLPINSRSDHVLATNQRIGYMTDFNVNSSCLHVMKLVLVKFDHTIYGKQDFNLLGNMYSYWSVGPIHGLKDVTIYIYYIICFARKPYIISTERLFAVKCMVRCVMLLSDIVFDWLSIILLQPNINSKVKYPGRLYIKVNSVTFTDTCYLWISNEFSSCSNCYKRNNPFKD